MHPTRFRGLCAALVFALAGAVHAEALLKPLPSPDLSKLSKADRESLEGLRKQFDETKPSLIDVPLAEAYAKLAAAYARFGLDDVALVATEDATLLAPDDGRFHYLHGFFNVKLKRYAAARTDLERAAKLDKDYLPIRYRLGDVLMQLNDFAAARKVLEPIAAERPELAPAHAGLGEVAMREKKYAEAVEHFERALKADPEATAIYGRLADAVAVAGDAARAQTLRAQAGNGQLAFADPLVAGIYAPPQAGTPVQRALAIAGKGNLPLARQILDEALHQKADDLDALIAYARIELLANDLAAAGRHADAALKVAPNDGGANLAAAFVRETRGDDAGAIPLYAKAAAVEATQAEARVLLGNAYLRKRQFAQAIETYRALAAKRPDDPDALAHVVAAYAVAGQCGQGLAAARSAHDARPHDGLAAQIFVRAASSCSTATVADKQSALEVAQALYKARPSEDQAEALAMALAANGRTKDAIEYEGQVVFAAVKAKNQSFVDQGKGLIKRFESGKPAELPWPAGNAYVAPPSLAASAPPAAAPAKS